MRKVCGQKDDLVWSLTDIHRADFCSFEVQAHDKEEEKIKKSGGAIAADLAQDSLKNNLRKTLEIIDACFDLKEAYLKQLYPNETQKEIAGRIYQGILKRKEAQWKLQKDS